MSTKNSEPEVPVRRLDRFLAFTALGIAAASVVCFFAIIIGTAVGMDQSAFGEERGRSSRRSPTGASPSPS